MKKILLAFGIVFVLCFCLCSCETTVGIRTLVPAKVNLATYDLVGVVSTNPYDSVYDSAPRRVRLELSFSDPYLDRISRDFCTSYFGLSEGVARYASNIMTLAVRNSNSAYNNGLLVDNLINQAKRTGSTIKSVFEANGIDAVIKSEITDQILNEYLDVNTYYIDGPNKTKILCYRVYLVRKARLGLSYSLIDVQKNEVLNTGYYEDSEEKRYYLGYKEGNSSFVQGHEFLFIEDGSKLFERILDRIGRRVKNDFSQDFLYSYFNLKKSSNPMIEQGIELADAQLYNEALEIFENLWTKTGSFESGYNTAVMYFAIGNYDKAQETAYKVWMNTMDSKARRLYERFISLAANDISAKKQLGLIDGDPVAVNETELVGF